MTTAEDLAKQKKQADDQKREAEKMIAKQKALLTGHIAELDKQKAAIEDQRTKAVADLNKLG